MRLWKLLITAMIATAPLSLIGAKELTSGTAVEAIQQAQQEEKHLFFFFYEDSSASTQQMQGVFDEAMRELGSESLSMKVSMDDPSEHSIIKKFELKYAPMPLAIVLAPNGAMVRGFPKRFSKDQLLSSLVTPSMASCLKALQEQKLVLLCIQGENTKNNEAAMRGVKEFQGDARFAAKTQIVVINPDTVAEKTFIEELGLTPSLAEATTVMMSPPAEKVGTFVGPTSKQMLVSTLTKASKGCGPGGCPNGCN